MKKKILVLSAVFFGIGGFGLSGIVIYKRYVFGQTSTVLTVISIIMITFFSMILTIHGKYRRK